MPDTRITQILEDFLVDGIPVGTTGASNYSNDSFGRQRIGLPTTQYQYAFEYNKAPLIWGEKVTGTGVATHIPLESSITLSTGSTTDTNGVIRQTFQYFRYSPGKSLEFQETFALGAITENVIKRVGYFDDTNGVYFEQDGENGVYKLTVRTDTSGSAVNNEIIQANWNIDKFDGTGISGITADFTKTQIFSTNLQWLGVGSALCGFTINRNFYPAHIFNHSNLLDKVYMRTANLPLRYQIFNRGTAGGIATFKQICATVITNGGFDEEISYEHAVENLAVKASVGTTFTNLISIRPKATFNSIPNRGTIRPLFIEVNNVGTGNLIYRLIYNGAVAGSPSYSSAGANSIVEFDVAGTTITGGERITSGQVVSSKQTKASQKAEVGARYPLTLDIDGANPKILTLAVRAVTGTVDAMGAITFSEVY